MVWLKREPTLLAPALLPVFPQLTHALMRDFQILQRFLRDKKPKRFRPPDQAYQDRLGGEQSSDTARILSSWPRDRRWGQVLIFEFLSRRYLYFCHFPGSTFPLPQSPPLCLLVTTRNLGFVRCNDSGKKPALLGFRKRPQDIVSLTSFP